MSSAEMSGGSGHSSVMLQLLHQANEGDPVALDALLRRYGERLTLLARRMLGGFQRVRRWAETDDVLQSALVRLIGALREARPRSQREFLGLAALQIRRELIDMARHYFGPQGSAAHHDSHARDALERQPAPGEEPAALMQWCELHQFIDRLPEEEREVMGLLFYQGLSQVEAAQLLDVSVRTIQRRWHAALQKLHGVWMQ